jgi:hypothetical protein
VANEERVGGVQFGSNPKESLIDTDLLAHKAGKVWGKVELFLADYSIYDILGFVFVIVLGFLFIVLAVAMRKNIVALILLIVVALGTLAGGPFAMGYMVDSVTRKTVVSSLDIKQLNYTKALVINGRLRNAGKIDLRDCKIIVEIWKKSNSSYKEYIRMFQKPKYKKIFKATDRLPLRGVHDFKVVYDNFRTPGKSDVIVRGECR